MTAEAPSRRARLAGRWADLQVRLRSAAVLVPLAILSIWVGGVVLAALLACVLALSFHEWDMMLARNRPSLRGRTALALVLLAPLVDFAMGVWWAGAFVLASAAVTAIWIDGRQRHLLRAAGILVFGAIGIAIISLRGSAPPALWNDGIAVALYLAFIVTWTDSGAFFAGRIFGGARLSPEISPSKTWTGAIGGLALGTIGGSLVWLFATPSPLWIGAAIAAATSLLAQLGDLAESAVKRRFLVKDSSDMIPGHGGILDRLDSFSLASIGLFMIGVSHAGIGAVTQGVLNW